METAQFYYFCQQLFPEETNYLSFKGASNSLADQALQTTHSLGILQKALAASFVVLGVPTQASTVVAAVAPVAPREDSSASKLMEEVKLYWTIQIAVCGVLGYLGTNLALAPPPAPADMGVLEADPAYLKNLCVSGISFFLIQIGAMYNVVGNYYARVTVSGSTLGVVQENRITPILALFYLAISGAIAALGVKTGVPNATEAWLFWAALVGVAMNWIVCRGFVYRGLPIGRDGRDDYFTYATPLRRLYLASAIVILAVAAYWWFAWMLD
jgi:hypothetical protein